MHQEKLLHAAAFIPNSLEIPNAWVGHLPFAAWVIQEVSPRIFVELGTHSGNSFFSFCQSVSENGLTTKCFAVDTWQGDEHAGHYGDEVFSKVSAHHQAHYDGFSRLLRMTFDEAVTYFADESIELLHIDGLHTYEAVKHDFETWLPKLAAGAIVIFHDTNVRERHFGVWKLWEELQVRYPKNLEFLHSNGLGILQLNNATDAKNLEWLQPNSPIKQKLSDYFSVLGARQLERYDLNFWFKPQIVNLNQVIADRDGQISAFNQSLAGCDGQIADLSQAVIERDSRLNELTATINSLLNSRSWQITRPLRFLIRLVKSTLCTGQLKTGLKKSFLVNFGIGKRWLSRILPSPVKIIIRKILVKLPRKQLASLILPKLNVVGVWPSKGADRKTVLVVSHVGSRTGAPILSFNIIRILLKNKNVIALFIGPGPILDACAAEGAVVVGPMLTSNSEVMSELAINQILAKTDIDYAIVNSIESRFVLPTLAAFNIPTVSLIHEFAAYTRPRNAFNNAVYWAGSTVFSSRITMENMIDEYPHLGEREYSIIPQGRSILPSINSDKNEKSEFERSNLSILKLIRPDKFSDKGVVFLGVGYVQYRKGVDIFIDCAASIMRKSPNLEARFIWVGDGYDPEYDLQASVYLADQVRRAGLDDHVFFVGEVTSLDEIYMASNIMILSSRLDPLPNVAIDALTCGLPVLCFDKTTGIADILKEHGLGTACVANYIDIDEMASKALDLALSDVLRKEVSKKSKAIAAGIFNMEFYVDKLEKLAFLDRERIAHAELDAKVLMQLAQVRLDFYCIPNLPTKSKALSIQSYLRSWASGVGRRKLFPGFNPGIYLEKHGISSEFIDPLADYLSSGKPKGSWNFDLISSIEEPQAISSNIRIALHIHVYYPELFPEIFDRIKLNKIRPDLLISVPSDLARTAVLTHLHAYKDSVVDVRVVPNRGRDIGPFITEFREAIRTYDFIGHLHTKKSLDIKDQNFSRTWYLFLLENLLGGESPMADIILGRMANDPKVGMVYPDDPYIVGWGKNLSYAEVVLAKMGITGHPLKYVSFPVGTMFWARTSVLSGLFDLQFQWEDYPNEPLPYDGSLLHALERVFGLIAPANGYSTLLTNVQGVTR